MSTISRRVYSGYHQLFVSCQYLSSGDVSNITTQSGQCLCCSLATTSFMLMTLKILCVAGRRVPLDDYSINSFSFSLIRL